MVRPRHCRRVDSEPVSYYFKPAGVSKASLEEVILTIDEWEALRLADFKGTYHDGAAKSMRVSRQTFGRIIEGARKKVAQALICGHALIIKGGDYEMTTRKFTCFDCKHKWELDHGTGRPETCPSCEGTNFHREQNVSENKINSGKGKKCRRQHGKQCSPV